MNTEQEEWRLVFCFIISSVKYAENSFLQYCSLLYLYYTQLKLQKLK